MSAGGGCVAGETDIVACHRLWAIRARLMVHSEGEHLAVMAATGVLEARLPYASCSIQQPLLSLG